MSAVSNVAVVPDYISNADDQALVIANTALTNSTTAVNTSNTALTNSTNAVNTANQSLTNSTNAINQIPFSMSSYRSTGWTPINTFTEITSFVFTPISPNCKMIFWANLNIHDTNIITGGSVFQAKMFLNNNVGTSSPTTTVSLQANGYQTVSLLYPFVGDSTINPLTIQLLVLTVSGGIIVLNAQLIGIINIQ